MAIANLSRNALYALGFVPIPNNFFSLLEIKKPQSNISAGAFYVYRFVAIVYLDEHSFAQQVDRFLRQLARINQIPPYATKLVV